MNNKQYPTRMHEVLGVDPWERFDVKWKDCTKTFRTDNFGNVQDMEFYDSSDDTCYPANGWDVSYMVNHPDRITRRPRLTEEQVERLKAWLVVGFRWMAKDKEEGDICVYVSKPKKYEEAEIWGEGGKFGYVIGPEKELISWSDPEPLDIVATLKANGVEVE